MTAPCLRLCHGGADSPPTSAAALIEALMGFQFNHVGGGTKTRRPITLHMQYNAGCVQPQCFLVTEDFGDQEVTLEELQVGVTCFPGLRCCPPTERISRQHR